MKFHITFKDPNAAAGNSQAVEKEGRAVWEKFVKYDEYVTIEFDTRTMKAKVVSVRRAW